MMSKELLSPETLQYAALALPTILAFSSQVRRIIGRRDGWRCTEPGCWRSLRGGFQMHAMHLNHDRSNPAYDDPETGKLTCLPHHLNFHVKHIGHAEDIGLTESQNDWAIDKLEHTPIMIDGQEYKAISPQDVENINQLLLGF